MAPSTYRSTKLVEYGTPQLDDRSSSNLVRVQYDIDFAYQLEDDTFLRKVMST
jgi:hypothetical protein